MLLYKYCLLITLVAGYFLTELIVGLYANSITLQTDAFHMLSDLVALCIGTGALLVLKRERHHRYTYGWLRAEIVGGLINSVFLLAVCFMLLIESILKIIELAHNTANDRLENEINLVLWVAVGGFVVNIIGLALFYNEHTQLHSHDVGTKVHNHAQYAVLLHIIGDTLGSVLVIASSLLIKYTDGVWKFYVDPVASIVIILFISISSCKLLHSCIKILMHHWQGEPVKDIEQEILKINGIVNVHDFHVWSLNGKFSIATLHINLANSTKHKKSGTDRILKKVKAVLHNYGIHCSCIQPEWTIDCIEPSCEKNCDKLRCCTETPNTDIV